MLQDLFYSFLNLFSGFQLSLVQLGRQIEEFALCLMQLLLPAQSVSLSLFT